MSATLYEQPNYPLRRAVALVIVLVALVIACSAAIATVEAVADLGGRPAAASESAPESEVAVVRIHVAESGDTLWSIAEHYRGDVARDRYVDALIDLNEGTSIQVGQAVRLP